VTPSPTATASATVTPSPTESPTPTQTITQTATATPAQSPTATPTTAVIEAVADNSAGPGKPSTTIPGTSEPAGSGEAGLFLISVVAIQGTGASTATITLPSTPGAWTAIGNWSCNSGFGSEIQIAAAYRITTGSDAPGVQFSWSFSDPFEGSVVNTVYRNVNASTPIDAIGAPTCALGSAGSIVTAAPVITTVSDDVLIATFAAAGTNNDTSLTVGSLLGPVVGQDNSALGPADFNGFALTTDLPPSSGDPGSYGPYTAVQNAAGESIAILITAKPQ